MNIEVSTITGNHLESLYAILANLMNCYDKANGKDFFKQAIY